MVQRRGREPPGRAQASHKSGAGPPKVLSTNRENFVPARPQFAGRRQGENRYTSCPPPRPCGHCDVRGSDDRSTKPAPSGSSRPPDCATTPDISSTASTCRPPARASRRATRRRPNPCARWRRAVRPSRRSPSPAACGPRDGVWRRLAPRERLEILYRLAALIDEHTAEFTLLDSLCMGKPVRDMVAVDVPQSSLTFRYFAELSDKVESKVTATRRRRLPLHAARAAGRGRLHHAVELPADADRLEDRPGAGGGQLRGAQGRRAGAAVRAAAGRALRPGRRTCRACSTSSVASALEAGAPLALHPDVAKISFTGSTVTGKKMLVYAGQSNMKRVSLECGGKSPQIFLHDLEDLDRAVTYAINGIFGVMGEVCSAGSRLLVDRRIAADFTAPLHRARPHGLRRGRPARPGHQHGPAGDAEAARARARLHPAGSRGRRDGRLRRRRARPARATT